MWTTIDVDPAVFAALKQRQAVDGRTLGVLVSELLASALGTTPPPAGAFPRQAAAPPDLVHTADRRGDGAALDG